MTKRPTNSGSFRPIGATAAEIVSDMKFRHEVKLLHELGPRVLTEYLGELAAERGIRVIVERKIERYAALDIDALELAGGDRFPALPVYLVRP